MKDVAKLNHMRAPKYIGKQIVGKDSLPYTFVDLQHQIEQARPFSPVRRDEQRESLVEHTKSGKS